MPDRDALRGITILIQALADSLGCMQWRHASAFLSQHLPLRRMSSRVNLIQERRSTAVTVKRIIALWHLAAVDGYLGL